MFWIHPFIVEKQRSRKAKQCLRSDDSGLFAWHPEEALFQFSGLIFRDIFHVAGKNEWWVRHSVS